MVVNFKVFKKCSPNNMITLYMNRREFVDSVTQVEPIGRWEGHIECMMVELNKYKCYLGLKRVRHG